MKEKLPDTLTSPTQFWQKPLMILSFFFCLFLLAIRFDFLPSFSRKKPIFFCMFEYPEEEFKSEKWCVDVLEKKVTFVIWANENKFF